MSLIIYKLSSGDCVHRYNKSIVIPFKGIRKVLSTSPSNGGYKENLTAVFNNDGNPGAGMACKLLAPTYEEHMRLIAAGLGLDPDKTAGISTAASMDNVSIKSESFEDLTVTAIVTGGVEVNGGRAGDPASYHERAGKAEMLKPGTINIILVIEANLPEGTMARALVTCTEAKTAALQELMAGSNYSTGLATGSGTDGTIIVCNPLSELSLTNAGKHSKLGELIGCSVKAAVKEALFLQTGLCPGYQHSILKRMKRYGVTEEKLWQYFCGKEAGNSIMKADFTHRLHMLEKEEGLVTLTSLLVHILDQLQYELLEPVEAVRAGEMLLELLEKYLQALTADEPADADDETDMGESCQKQQCFDVEANKKAYATQLLLDSYTAMIASAIGGIESV